MEGYCGGSLVVMFITTIERVTFMINEGRTDRIIRVVIGVVFAILAFSKVGGLAGEWIFGILAAVAIITGITGVCGLYRLVGIRTCPIRK